MSLLDQLVGPLINGHKFDYSSIELNVEGQMFTAVQEISYSHTLEPGVLRGTKPQKIGRTRGEYNAEGSLTMYLADYKSLITLLALKNPTVGYMEQSFTITVMYQELAVSAQLITDVLIGCRFTSVEHSHSQGNEALQTSVNLDIMSIIENGLPPVFDNSLA